MKSLRIKSVLCTAVFAVAFAILGLTASFTSVFATDSVKAEAKLSLGEEIVLKTTLSKIPDGYTAASMSFTLDGETETVEATVENNAATFEYKGITPNYFSSQVAMSYTLTGDEQTTLENSLENFSVDGYAAKLLSLYPDDEELKQLVVDMYAYGEALKNYSGEGDTSLTNVSDYKTSQSAFTEIENPNVKSVNGTSDKLTWEKACLYFDYKVNLAFSFSGTFASKPVLKISKNGGEEEVVEELEKVETDGKTTYRGIYRSINLSEYDTKVTAIVYDGEEKIEKTVDYSLDSAVYAFQSEEDGTYKQVVQRMYNYGLSAVAYENHKCESKCPTCGKCMDLICKRDVCAKKCNDGKKDYAFEAEQSIITDGSGSYSITEGTNRSYVGNLNGNKGAKLSFTVIAEEACTASLSVTVNRRSSNSVLTDKLGVSVNNEDDLSRDTVVTAYSPEWSEESFREFCIGCVSLEKGENTIVFTVKSDDGFAYNFDKITLYSSVVLKAHTCESVCEECGKCTDLACKEYACRDKCLGHSFVTLMAAKAETAKGKNGYPNYSNDYVSDSSKVALTVGNLSGNTGASLKFSFYSSVKGEANLVAGVTKRYTGWLFTDIFDIKVNDGDSLESSAKTVSGSDDWSNASDVYLGTITVKEGVNTVTFTQKDHDGVNFGYIKVLGGGKLSHACENVCEKCNKCTDPDCTEAACIDKCEHYVSYIKYGTDAVFGKAENGYTPGPESSRRGLVGYLNGNKGASLTYTFNAPKDNCKVKLIVAVTTKNADKLFTDYMTIKINDKDVDSTAKVPNKYGDSWYYTDTVELGEYTFNSGDNTVKFTVAGDCFNFYYVQAVIEKASAE